MATEPEVESPDDTLAPGVQAQLRAGASADCWPPPCSSQEREDRLTVRVEELARQLAVVGWERVVHGARRLRQLRRIWHCLGCHLHAVKQAGLEATAGLDSTTPKVKSP